MATGAEGLDQRVGTSLEAAATQVYLVEQTGHSPEPENFEFVRRFENRARNPHHGWSPEPHTIRSYQLLDVLLEGRFRGLFNAHGYIRGTSYLIPDDQMMTTQVLPDQVIDATEDVTVIVGCNLACDNYYHWITQALPAIDASLTRSSQDYKLRLALPGLTAWQEDSLGLLGHGGIRRATIEPGKFYAFSRVEYSELLRGEAAFRLSDACFRTFSRLRGAVEYSPQARRKLYVARTDAANRVMRNESAVIEALRGRGYDIIVPGSLSLAEQISLFRSAGIVVGPHGAGMTNIAFCEPGTVVYELLPSHYNNACFCNLAHVCRLRYWADQFDSEGEGLPNLRDWASDTALVLERVAEIEAVQAVLLEEAQRQTISAMDFLRGKPGLVHNLEPMEPPPAAAPPPSVLRRFWQGLRRRPAA